MYRKKQVFVQKKEDLQIYLEIVFPLLTYVLRVESSHNQFYKMTHFFPYSYILH